MNRVRNEILIRAPAERVFSAISHLGNWPVILSHYRWTQPLPDGSIKMSAWRGPFPVRWVSRYHTDPEKQELHFEHLSPITRGIRVCWKVIPKGGCETLVTVEHDLNTVRGRRGRYMTDTVIGKFFIDHMARKTLTAFKQHLEKA